MNDQKKYALLNYIFVLGLALLLLNDHVLKSMYGNWFTGKLSDFAGVLILPIILNVIFSTCLPPGRYSIRKSIGATVLFFLFWKSPFSQPFLDAFNSLTIFQIDRVIDYSDYLAFLILPLSIYVLKHSEKFAIKLRLNTQWATHFLFLLTIIAFIATSKPLNIATPEDPIKLCCEKPPAEYVIGGAHVFIPSAFTPDGNGINDYFQIGVDSNVIRIDTFVVFNQFSKDIIFYKENITNIIPENGFDGYIENKTIAAQFSYNITVSTKDVKNAKLIGSVCSLPCNQSIDFPASDLLSNCSFLSQHNALNGFVAEKDSGENLDCFVKKKQ